jgi:hypothetical protein
VLHRTINGGVSDRDGVLTASIKAFGGLKDALAAGV